MTCDNYGYFKIRLDTGFLESNKIIFVYLKASFKAVIKELKKIVNFSFFIFENLNFQSCLFHDYLLAKRAHLRSISLCSVLLLIQFAQ